MTFPSIAQPYGSADDVVDGFRKLEDYFLNQRDRRGVFVTAYLVITEELRQRLRNQHFEDNPWTEGYLVAFADLYRRALLAYEAKHWNDVPKPWKLAFDISGAGSGLVLQDLMLGINAHINHDLPLALLAVGIDPDRESRKRDHTRVNAALRVATDPVQKRLSDAYAPQLGILDLFAGALDEMVTNFSFSKARRAAWRWAVQLVDAPTTAFRQHVQQDLESQAERLGRAAAAPSILFPGLTHSLRHLENTIADWRRILLG